MAIKIKTVKKNFIPPITDPMGKGWDQPSPKLILVDDKHALMSQDVFDRLMGYSTSQPSGVYPGKMWKSHEWKSVNGKMVWTNRWFLAWFGLHTNPKLCSNNYREIIIT